MIPLLLLIGCEREDAAPCAIPAQDPWAPALEIEVRLDADSADWTPAGAATVDPAVTDGCAAPPCIVATGPGGATLTLALNRGTPYTLGGSVTLSAAGHLAITQRMLDGSARTLLDRPVDAGTTLLDDPFALAGAGAQVSVTLTLADGGSAALGDLQILGERWAASADGPASLGADSAVRLGFLMHVEDHPSFLTDEVLWRRRARIFEGVSATLAAHGARLTIQADATFVRGAAIWDPDWIAARTAEGVDWSVHIHDEDAESAGVEQAIRDGRTALRDAGIRTSDLNGGFGSAPWLAARLAGMSSLSAYKNPETQGGLPLVQLQPWRPSEGVGASDPAAFLLDDPEGPLLYLPGFDVREVDHARFPTTAGQALSQVMAHAQDDALNVWYYVLHVDGFGPAEEAALELWLGDGSLDAALVPYAEFLTTVTDPFVAEGLLEYDTSPGMAAAWRERYAACVVEAVSG